MDRNIPTLAAIVSALAILSSPAGSAELPAETRQVVVVRTDDWDSHRARMLLFVREKDVWKKEAAFDAVVGSKGLAWGMGSSPPSEPVPAKREGDRKAPAGIFRLLTAMGYASAPPEGTGVPYEQITADLFCVDDPSSSYYNTIVHTGDLPAASPPWSSAETMLRKDPLYKLLLVVDYNRDAREPGAGSCIFVHIMRTKGKGTAGCTAVSESDMLTLLRWLRSDAHPVLVQYPRSLYDALWKESGLPDPGMLD